MKNNIYLYILVMATVTYAIRLVPLTLIRKEIDNEFFVEFGVENYKEANTKFLMFNNNWSGFVMDGSTENIENLKKQDYFWKYDLKAKDVFITKENINDLLLEQNINPNVGLLHIDLDGNDYYIFNEI